MMIGFYAYVDAKPEPLKQPAKKPNVKDEVNAKSPPKTNQMMLPSRLMDRWDRDRWDRSMGSIEAQSIPNPVDRPSNPDDSQ